MAKQSTTGVMTRLLILYLAMTVAYAFLRQPIGTAMNVVLGGLVTNLQVPLFITILMLSLITGSYSSLLLNQFVDQQQVKQSQAKMKEFLHLGLRLLYLLLVNKLVKEEGRIRACDKRQHKDCDKQRHLKIGD